jgi:uncharacterized protein
MATVTVRGRAEGDVEPDRVRLGYVVQAEAAVGAEALTMVAERSAAADEALDRAGDLLLLRRPAAVTLAPVWSNTGEVTGQAARRFVLVEARAVGPLGELLAALVAVPGSIVESTEWVVDARNPVHARLRAAAVADARERAADYAQAADLRLGALEWITEPDVRPGEPGWPGWPGPQAVALGLARNDAGGSPVLELRPEPVAVSTAVDVRYALLG